jgi:hypothetical protein
MMLYQNRIFVATPEVHDVNGQGGYEEIVGDMPVVPRIFVPLGATLYGAPVTRIGVMGVYSIQKALYHWFTSDRHIEITEADWLEAIPPIPESKENVMTMVVIETAEHQFAAFIGRNPTVIEAVVGATLESTSEDLIGAEVLYTMQLVQIQEQGLLSDSTMVIGDKYASFNLTSPLCSLPPHITAQMVLRMFDLLHKRELYKWEVSEMDPRGVNEIPIEPCSISMINGYAQFLNAPTPRDKKLFS